MTPPEFTRQAKIRRIKSGSLFKLVFIISLSVFIPFFLLCGTAAFFGAKTVSVGQNHVTGWWGLIAAIIMAPLFAAVFGGITWFFAYLSIRILGKFSPLVIEYVPAEDPAPLTPTTGG